MAIIKQKFKIKGIDCDKCEKIVADQAFSVSGVKSIDFYRKENLAEIEMEENINLNLIFEKIREKGYACEKIAENTPEKIEEIKPESLTLVAGLESTTNNITTAPLAQSKITHKKFQIKNMICGSCENVISKAVHKLPGIKKVMIYYNFGTGEVSYDEKQVSFKEIKSKIEEKGYNVIDKENPEETSEKKKSWMAWLFAGIGIILVGYFALQLYSKISLPEISQNMGYGLLFVVGLLTGFHCIAMCGGFVISYTAKGAAEGKKPHKLHLSYALGKTLSYTIMGALFGLLGSIIAFTPTMRGIAGILAGLFLIIFGIKMLGIFPGLRKFKIKWPEFMNRWIGKESMMHSNSPLITGLLNGLMIACGPLQAMYILAAGTGNMIEGAKMLFVFGLGTLPVMLGFGYFASLISSKATMKILKASGILVILLGLIMFNRGLALTGGGYDFNSLTSKLGILGNAGSSSSPTQTLAGTTFKDGYQEIKMTVDSNGFTPNKFVLKKGVPVKWVIDGKQLNGCNNAIIVSKYGLNFKVKSGIQTIEFTPTESGTVSWSCWMGMLQGVFIVQDNVDADSIVKAASQVQVPKGGSCGAGGGGCGCGGAR